MCEASALFPVFYKAMSCQGFRIHPGPDCLNLTSRALEYPTRILLPDNVIYTQIPRVHVGTHLYDGHMSIIIELGVVLRVDVDV